MRQGLPAGDGPGAVPRLIVVGDAREQPVQLEDGQHFATALVRRAIAEAKAREEGAS